MKYKVVGWTFYDDDEILSSRKTIGFAERNAIIDEIRKNEYLFSGYDHQESWDGVVPILNDGLKRCFSQRGWGGVMAEAYGYMNDYDYVSFSFDGSVDFDKVKTASCDFDIDSFVPEVILNEHFDVTVTEGLFSIAKNENPFYLDDLDSLRFIDENDTITLHCNGEELMFCVKSIDRNKKKINFKKHDLINGDYKIIVYHKPLCEKKENKLPVCMSKTKAFSLFDEVLEEYNFNVLNNILEVLDVDVLTSNCKKKNLKKTFVKFVNDYINSDYESSKLIRLLDYINDFNLYKTCACAVFEKDKYIMINFIKKYMDSDINIDFYILMLVDNIEARDLYYGTFKIFLKAISLRVDDKSLRRKYYKAIKDSAYEGFSIMAGLGLYRYLRKSDKCLIELDNYVNHEPKDTMRFLEYFTYPNKAVYSDLYPYKLPKIYEDNNPIIEDGIYAYQNYIKKSFNIDDLLLDMLNNAIDKICYKMDCYYRGFENAANYILTLDLLTDYKYNFKDMVLSKYGCYENFVKIINSLYK